MKLVTTQANTVPAQSPNRKIAEMINNLTCDLMTHASGHSPQDLFVANCAECIYWSAKVVQHPELWQESYRMQQVQSLKPLPLEVINAAIEKVAPSDNTGVRAFPFNSQEYLQVVFA